MTIQFSSRGSSDFPSQLKKKKSFLSANLAALNKFLAHTPTPFEELSVRAAWDIRGQSKALS